MLILSRKLGEKIIIGNDITLTILGVRGSQVRLGVGAPATVPVHREEVYQRIQAEKRLIATQQSIITKQEGIATNTTDTK